MSRFLWNRLALRNISDKSISPFASDVLKLAGSTAFAQALAVLVSPIITRLYGPEAFGTSALFMSIIGIISVVACLRYEMAILLPKEEKEAANLFGLSLLIAVIISIILVPIIWIVQEPLIRLLNAPELAPYMWLLSPAVFLSGAFMALNYWNSRSRRFGRLSIAKINASVATTGVKIVAGLKDHATGGSLIWASIFGSVVSTLILGWEIWRDDQRVFLDNINFRCILNELGRYKRFPIFDTWSSLLGSLSFNSPALLFSYFFNSATVGFYSLGYMVLTLPMNLIGSSIGQVFFQRAARAKHEGNLGILVENIVLLLIIISIYPLSLIFLFGQELFSITFGTQWSEAGLYAQILAPWIFIVFVTSPISTLFSILEKQSNSLLINIILLILRAGSIILGGIIGNAIIGLILFSLIGFSINAVVLIWLMNKSGASIEHLLFSLPVSMKYCIPFFLLSGLIKFIAIEAVYVIVICIITTILYYYIISKDIINIWLSKKNN